MKFCKDIGNLFRTIPPKFYLFFSQHDKKLSLKNRKFLGLTTSTASFHSAQVPPCASAAGAG